MLALPALAGPSFAAPPRALRRRHYPAQRSWAPEPPQAPVTEGLVDVGGGDRIWYWDTGGSGPALVLLHAFTGSAACWGYQQPVFRQAGYRVIAYSRRGHFRSEAAPGALGGTGAGDLQALAAHLRLPSFHLLGTAGGSFVALDYAVSHPDRLLSLTIACSTADVDEPEYRAACARLATPEFMQLPNDLKELGPAYRAGYPEGHARWSALEETARTRASTRQAKLNRVTWAELERLRVPTLLISGGADNYSPPPLMEMVARRIPDASLAIIDEAGHSAFWEQPLAFNEAVLGHLRRHRAAR
jgi:pimeloyl-ACP methyl ester carboxylesterase